ncbi:MAG: cobalamin-dependent protein [Candidatus Adiutrix sp.]|jgi:5-methyltetrahydrofolate--homocysteine methyltransferase|nr:cobalamin-dependent protein [Candidatus Adiutrix sp.]
MKKTEADLARLKRELVELDVDGAVRLVRRLNGRQGDPAEIMAICEEALHDIGERYAEGEYYIAGLIMAGEIMNRIIAILAPRLGDGVVRRDRGRVLIGTVKGDIHDLGKNMAGALLSVYGFEVRDLGVDVPVEEFIRAMTEFQPKIVGLSVLLSSCYANLAAIVEAIRKVRGDSSTPHILISGNHITPEHCRLFQADCQAASAFDTVRLCEKLIQGDSAGRA